MSLPLRCVTRGTTVDRPLFGWLHRPFDYLPATVFHALACRRPPAVLRLLESPRCAGCGLRGRSALQVLSSAAPHLIVLRAGPEQSASADCCGRTDGDVAGDGIDAALHNGIAHEREIRQPTTAKMTPNWWRRSQRTSQCHNSGIGLADLPSGAIFAHPKRVRRSLP